jgi:hypothetical protein
MSMHQPRVNGRIALERTGPYIPPITLPGISDIVLTAEARKLLESSKLNGFSFLPIEKVHIVDLRWEEWDLGAIEPVEYPESGEPEDYILANPHSPATANALGDLWEVEVPQIVTALRPKPTVSSYKELQLDLSTRKGEDLIKGSGYGSVLFSERARDWFSEHWGKYLQFEPFPTT